ncbi:unnamed protein product [Symbiodinium natans]|uniref:Secreted protein n=1 Tax=Symbiodinium natans TaxID=878477 RepID=A0A812TDH9_9DINO|nr:unnamed protein product [Symbiodinium natans]
MAFPVLALACALQLCLHVIAHDNDSDYSGGPRTDSDAPDCDGLENEPALILQGVEHVYPESGPTGSTSGAAPVPSAPALAGQQVHRFCDNGGRWDAHVTTASRSTAMHDPAAVLSPSALRAACRSRSPRGSGPVPTSLPAVGVNDPGSCHAFLRTEAWAALVARVDILENHVGLSVGPAEPLAARSAPVTDLELSRATVVRLLHEMCSIRVEAFTGFLAADFERLLRLCLVTAKLARLDSLDQALLHPLLTGARLCLVPDTPPR